MQIKKYRKQEQCFIVQGAKSVQELLASDYESMMVVGTPEFLQQLPPNIKAEVFEAKADDLKALGEFQSNDAGLAVAKMKTTNPPRPHEGEFVLALDDIRDPGNLGTIIRTADWYGVTAIVASPETADFYNPKVISATMGSFTRVNVHYEDLPTFLSTIHRPVYGAFLEGKDIHQQAFSEGGVILIGNESRGVSSELERFVTQKITIPRFGNAESLNAAIATAIILDNAKRRSHN